MRSLKKSLSLRTRLLLAFAAISFLVLVLCVILSYRIAIDIAENKEAALTGELIKEAAIYISPHLGDDGVDMDSIQRDYAPLRFREQLLVIQGKGGVFTIPVNADIAQDISRLLPAPGTDKTTPAKGSFAIKGTRYLWASFPIANTSYTLSLVRPINNEENSTFRSIVTRLLITSGAIFWISIWAALILSSWMAARLNRQNEAILYQALHDSLTELPNRTSLYQQLTTTLNDKENQKKVVALFVLDMDGFKEINDTLGHGRGDEILKQVAGRLSALAKECVVIARLGGDEFAILHVGDHRSGITKFAHDILHLLEEPFLVNDIDLHMKASLGAALFPDDGSDPETLIRCAEVAMYAAKETKSGLSFYKTEQDPFSIRRLTLLGELKQAIKENQLQLYYQPKLDLGSGKVVAAEALVRWQHPKLGFISPGEFIDLAEQSGLIKQLTLWVVNRALCDCRSWLDRGVDLCIAVNVSPHNLYDEKFTAQIAGLLAQWKVLPRHLELEITESAMMVNVDRTLGTLSYMKELGLHLSVDDFGTGFSSLSYLQRLPVDQLKIDQSFVRDMETNENNRMIVRSIIDLAHDLNFKVVAEGVESASGMEILREMGCDVIQGYYLSKPISAEQLEQWLKSFVLR